MIKPTCLTCPYFSPGSAEITGRCFKTHDSWPIRHSNEWCGEHPGFHAWLKSLEPKFQDTLPNDDEQKSEA